MNLRIARFLLFLSVVGNLAPVGMAMAAPPTHACCIRKSLHPCHESATTTAEHSVLRSADCCNRDCCRGVTTARWAHAQSATEIENVYLVGDFFPAGDSISLRPAGRGSRYTRGPPRSSRA